MKRQYYEIYEMLYADYINDFEFRRPKRFPTSEYYFIRSIRRSINALDTKDILRPDAKFFLLVNFHQLIVKPIIERDFEPIALYDDDKRVSQLISDISADLERIISLAKESSIEEISGHQIMNAIDKIWPELKTTKFEIWG